MIAPEVVGNYVIDGEIGRGGMGVVYAATHRVLGDKAAIKLLLAEMSARGDQVERFFNEARALRAVSHPGIVELLDVGVMADGRAYLVMERLAGESLAARLRAGRMPVRTAIEIGVQIADALAAAHAVGIIHRDLKPDNVFLTRDGRVKLLDFGIAKLTAANQPLYKTTTGAIVGTPHYMSPEQCAGRTEIDHRADLYALGCVLYRMVADRVPFDGESVLAVVAMHQSTPPVPVGRYRAEASPALAGVIDRLLAKAPGDRLPSAAAARDALADPALQVLAPSGDGIAVTADPDGAHAPAADRGAALGPTLPSPPSAGHTAPTRDVPSRDAPTTPPTPPPAPVPRAAPRSAVKIVVLSGAVSAITAAAVIVALRPSPTTPATPVALIATDAATPIALAIAEDAAPDVTDATSVAPTPAADADPRRAPNRADAGAAPQPLDPPTPTGSADAATALDPRDEIVSGDDFVRETRKLADAKNCAGLERYLAKFDHATIETPEGWDARDDLFACDTAPTGRFPRDQRLTDTDLDDLKQPDRIRDLFTWCIQLGPSVNVDAKTAPLCAATACTLKHVFYARAMISMFGSNTTGRDKVVAACKAVGLDLDEWE